MQEGNYIKVARSMLEWEWYLNINTKVLFLHMLLKANWKECRFEGTTVPRGSFVSSIGKLSEETGLTEREIRTAISHLKSTGEVTSKTTNKYTVFTVVKYDLYQQSDKQNDRQATGNRHSNDILTTTIEEKKEGKKERNIPPISPTDDFERFWSAYPNKIRRQQAEKEFLNLTISGRVSAEELTASAANYAEAVKITGEKMYYPGNFLQRCIFEDYLPENYRRLDRRGNYANKGIMRQDYGDMDALEKELMAN